MKDLIEFTDFVELDDVYTFEASCWGSNAFVKLLKNGLEYEPFLGMEDIGSRKCAVILNFYHWNYRDLNQSKYKEFKRQISLLKDWYNE